LAVGKFQQPPRGHVRTVQESAAPEASSVRLSFFSPKIVFYQIKPVKNVVNCWKIEIQFGNCWWFFLSLPQ